MPQNRLVQPGRRKARAFDQQSGYALMVVLFLIALMSLTVTAGLPAASRQIQRDREEEMIHRGQQYARAIRLYYRKFGHYPNTIQDLLDTNRLRFLRREYKDPMSADGKWHMLHVGEVTFTPTGFFGQSLQPNAMQPQQAGLTPASQMAAGSSGNTPSHFVTSLSTGDSSNPVSGDLASSSTASGSSSGPSPSSSSGSSSGAPSIGTQPASSPFSPIGDTGPTFGGGPIVGVSSTSEKQSLKVLNGKDHYNDWQFFYDPRFEVPLPQLSPPPQNPGMTPAGNLGTGNPGNPPPQNPANGLPPSEKN